MAEDERGLKVATFIEVAGCDDAGIAFQMLESTGWRVEDAIQLYFATGGGGAEEGLLGLPGTPRVDTGSGESGLAGRGDGEGAWGGQQHGLQRDAGEEAVRAPLPVRREALYGDTYFLNALPAAAASLTGASTRDPPGSGVGPGGGLTWASMQWQQQQQQQRLQQGQGVSLPPNPFVSAPAAQPDTPVVDAFRDFAQEAQERARASATAMAATAAQAGTEGDGVGSSSRAGTKFGANLATMYRPPLELLFSGTFDEAKSHAMSAHKWLLVNVQSTTEFDSHLMNRDTWSDEMVKDMVASYFILWQVDNGTVEGRKVCTYYNLHCAPVTMVVHPRTGQRQKLWEGAVQPQQLLEDLMPFIDEGPLDGRTAVAPPLKKQQTERGEASRRNTHPPAAAAAAATTATAAHAAVPAGLPDTQEVEDLDEEEQRQLHMALAASLEGREPEGVGPMPTPTPSCQHSAANSSANGGVYGSGPGDGRPGAERSGGGGSERTVGSGGAQEGPLAGEGTGVSAHGAVIDPPPGPHLLPLPEEPPAGAPGSCSVAVRFPEGSRVQRRFLLTDPLKVLKAFCVSRLPEAQRGDVFALMPHGPGSGPLDLDSDASIKDSGVAQSMLTLKWLH